METKYRIGGMVCLVVATALFWIGILIPLHRATEQAEIVRWIPRTSVIVALCVVFGIYFVATGNRYPYRDEARQTLTPVGWALFVVVAAAGAAGYFGMATTLTAMGYT